VWLPVLHDLFAVIQKLNFITYWDRWLYW